VYGVDVGVQILGFGALCYFYLSWLLNFLRVTAITFTEKRGKLANIGYVILRILKNPEGLELDPKTFVRLNLKENTIGSPKLARFETNYDSPNKG